MKMNPVTLAVPVLPSVVHGQPFLKKQAVEVDGGHFKKTLDGPKMIRAGGSKEAGTLKKETAMKKGSIHFQIQQVFLKSGIFTPGLSKHEAKLRARERGVHSWKEMGEEHTIYSFETAEAYLAVWHQLGRYAHLHGLNSIGGLTPEHVRSYLLSKIEEGAARSTYRLHTAAIMKLEKALRMQGMAVPSFRPVIDDLAKAARALRQNHVPRAYVDPSALIHAITREPLRLVARLQYEGGARVREVSLIKVAAVPGGGRRRADRDSPWARSISSTAKAASNGTFSSLSPPTKCC